ncbi:MAG: hypothetical protein ABI342_09010 [Nitrososphaera sp.]|jgi:hypothetical protein
MNQKWVGKLYTLALIWAVIWGMIMFVGLSTLLNAGLYFAVFGLLVQSTIMMTPIVIVNYMEKRQKNKVADT